MKGSRALHIAEHIGGNQYRLRISNRNPESSKQWFVFDRRTRTIRSKKDRDMALSNQKGYQYRIGVAAVMRKYIKESYQRSAYYGGQFRNIRNNANKCLDVHGGRNTHMRHVIFWNCHNGKNQGWTLDRTGIRYHKYPLKDGVGFQIKSQMKSKRALYYAEHIGRSMKRLRIRDNKPADQKQWFVFDWRTKTIRAQGDRKLVLAEAYGSKFRNAATATMQPYKSLFSQRVHWLAGDRRNIQHNGRRCLDVHGGSDSNNRHVIFYNCHNGLNQAWRVDTTVPKKIQYPPYPLADGVKFQIKSRMAGNRPLYYREHIGGNQFRVRIRDNDPLNQRQWWIFDSRTKTVRAYTKRTHALSRRNGTKMRSGAMVVVK